MAKENILTGLRASGKPHVGNYLGAIRSFVELQEDDRYQRFYFIADLHGLTTPFEPKELRASILEVAADYLALGLDPKKSALFAQSDVPAHAELAWIFNCITPLGELYRMTQFKDKSENAQKDSILAGLLNYPTLMAADILLYKPKIVPVGEDQVQHVELTRTIARKFNNKFGQTFPEPKPMLNKSTLRIKSLSDPEKKMSKTGDEALLLSDSPDEIRRKIKKAVTATSADGKSAGVENLMILLQAFGNPEDYKHFQNEIKAGTIKYSELKEVLSEAVIEYFEPFREKRKELLANPDKIARVLADGADKASEVANKTLLEVKEKIGLI